VNRGTPAVLAEPRCDFSKALFAIAKQVSPQATGTPVAAKPHRRKLSLVRG
jgi:hypothetical protein